MDNEKIMDNLNKSVASREIIESLAKIILVHTQTYGSTEDDVLNCAMILVKAQIEINRKEVIETCELLDKLFRKLKNSKG